MLINRKYRVSLTKKKNCTCTFTFNIPDWYSKIQHWYVNNELFYFESWPEAPWCLPVCALCQLLWEEPSCRCSLQMRSFRAPGRSWTSRSWREDGSSSPRRWEWKSTGCMTRYNTWIKVLLLQQEDGCCPQTEWACAGLVSSAVPVASLSPQISSLSAIKWCEMIIFNVIHWLITSVNTAVVIS